MWTKTISSRPIWSILGVSEGIIRGDTTPMPQEMKVEPVVLEGAQVRLEPLSLGHHAGLCEVGLDEELWRWIPVPVGTAVEMAAYIEKALQEQASGVSLPFALVEKASGRVMGSTRYGNIDRLHHRVGVGGGGGGGGGGGTGGGE